MLKNSKLTGWLLAGALLIAVLISALPVLVQLPFAQNDEAKCSIPTIRFLFEHGRPPLFLYSNAYMAPVQEVLAAIPFRLSGGSITSVRLVGVLLIWLGLLAWYRLLLPIYGRRVAIAVTSSCALCAVPVAIVRTILPSYSMSYLAIPLFLLVAYETRLKRPLLLGLVAGILHYFFPVALPYVAVVGCGLLLRALLDDNSRFKFSSRTLTTPLLYTLGFALVTGTVEFLFVHFERPYFETLGVELWSKGNSYHLRHYPDWPSMLSAFIGRIYPMAVSPQAAPLQTMVYDSRQYYFTGAGIFLMCLTLACTTKFGVDLAKGTDSLLSKYWRAVLPASFLLMTALLIPSWRLFGDPSMRYLIPFLPGVYAVLFSSLDLVLKKEWHFYSILGLTLLLNLLAAARSDLPAFMGL